MVNHQIQSALNYLNNFVEEEKTFRETSSSALTVLCDEWNRRTIFSSIILICFGFHAAKWNNEEKKSSKKNSNPITSSKCFTNNPDTAKQHRDKKLPAYVNA